MRNGLSLGRRHWSAGWPPESVRASSSVGTPITSDARRAAISSLDSLAGRHQHLAAHVAALLHRRELVLEVHPEAPLAIMFFISSKALSTPPKPASASATIGRK